MNTLKIILFFSFIALSTMADTNVVFQLYTSHNGIKYVYEVSNDLLARQPQLEKGNLFPPLAPRSAQLKAIKFANENVERRHWITQSINLIPYDDGHNWFYEVLLSRPLPDNFNGTIIPVKILILMDGSVAPMRKNT